MSVDATLPGNGTQLLQEHKTSEFLSDSYIERYPKFTNALFEWKNIKKHEGMLVYTIDHISSIKDRTKRQTAMNMKKRHQQSLPLIYAAQIERDQLKYDKYHMKWNLGESPDRIEIGRSFRYEIHTIPSEQVSTKTRNGRGKRNRISEIRQQLLLVDVIKHQPQESIYSARCIAMFAATSAMRSSKESAAVVADAIRLAEEAAAKAAMAVADCDLGLNMTHSTGANSIHIRNKIAKKKSGTNQQVHAGQMSSGQHLMSSQK